jgi:pimeloyl-ACP methyl ester carboxylesterase
MLGAKGDMRLRDGRRMSYSAAGPRDGFPVLYFHGAIGSPIRRSAVLDAAIARLHIRYLMVDRPGFGASDPMPGRTVADFPADIEDLADAIGFERFSVIGVSAGGPYALACAWALPDRLRAAAVVSSIVPASAPRRAGRVDVRYHLALTALERGPRLAARLADGALRILRRHPTALARAMAVSAPPAERALLAEREAREIATRSFLAATERGTSPMIEDYLACHRDWGFDSGAALGRVHLWHGAQDRLIPVEHARRLGGILPNCEWMPVPEDGHFFLRRCLDQILAPLVPDAGAGQPGRAALKLAA